MIATLEADEPAALMANSINWQDVFDVQVLPALEYGEAVKKLPKLLRK